ncbi:hypothetical protein GCM10010399_70050 [Dactylosporangium fulvum]|uniref:DUF7144 domain-containing protein n=1 Tax=Dactylosporangium fulvum TaxID=53359 RepID=A0ABY5W249_9ACTN|nr:hypothetical protein [Dactylosporangium fulvum]UWP83607.1 hypothetical protein Dfulv_04830 [Dactylosporangium fulvum]
MAETRTTRNRTMWFGWVTFAAVLLVVIGLLNVLEGLVALLQNQVTFIDGGSLVVVDLTGLGVVMIVFGGLLFASGIGLLARNSIARIVAIVVVALHALAQIGSLGAYPVWSLLMITLDVIVLFALTVHWADAREPEPQLAGGTHRMDRDTQPRAGGFPVNAPAAGRGVPAHAAPEEAPAPQQAPGHQAPAHAAPEQPESGYQQQSYQRQPIQPGPMHASMPPGSIHQGTEQQPRGTGQRGPNAGPYAPGQPGSPTHAAPTSGYGTGAV